MSFTDQVKEELTRAEKKGYQEQLAELAALIRVDGSIQISNKHLSLKVKLYHGNLARRIYSLIKDRFGFDIEIRVRQHKKFNLSHSYDIIVTPQPGVREFLLELGFLTPQNNLVFHIKEEYLVNRKLAQAYLRGIFLAGGSVNSPKSEYHLEFRCERESLAEDLIKLLAKFELEAHQTEHKGFYVVYFKSYDEVIKVLNIIGAHQAMLKMENDHIVKQLKNDVNRRVNFETANLEKSVSAAMDQLENIRIIEREKGLENLSPSLREMAQIRRENPYASLKELGEILDLSKSGVNHRLRRIKKIAENLA
ncbi:DNA-binding protein WhiA [Halanaerobium sp. Z-7514]|uniref:Probable cell division protein WhiA n=1 Tax=Halanaerobium polyolivorans TaxID=2886943 RepID=A0AAW4WTW6_9FIRM|nr:DNA-binding protein WhiA [Halanaerobium polyolivorans]MCC3144441.1 DNA-binding protein WhiA [Halanaerobium polyolivorans]RQD76372.1 MAG: DNA-binding protein WhiA [Halanaerobium sp. MSAO_Bac5]